MTTLTPMTALLPLLVAVPLAAAALTVLLRRPWLERGLLVGVPLAVAASGVALLVEHRHTPVLAHSMGGYTSGVAIPFASDTLTATMLVATGTTTAIASWFLVVTGEDRYRFVPSLALMLTAGVNGALLTADLFNLFVFVEVMLLPSYALIAVTGTWRRLGVARLFIVVNLVTSTILLMGVGLVYGVAGTVNLASLAGRAGSAEATPAATGASHAAAAAGAAADPRLGAAVAVVLLALLIKGGAVPVHGWLPRAYPATSAGIMALFSGLHTKVALYAVYRVYATLYGGAPAPWGWALAVVVLATILVGAIGTFGERRIRSALAYQMIAGVGHILIGVALLTPTALAAGLFYLVHHVVTMGALLLTAGAIEHVYGSGRFDRLSGLMRRERLAALIMVIGLFSLVGLPPTSGLWGKVALIRALADWLGGHPAWAVALLGAVVIASVASLMALQRVWGEVFWGKPMETYRPDDLRLRRGDAVPLPESVRIPRRLIAPGATLAAVSVAMFVGAGWLFPLADRAAAGLVRVGPYVEAVLR